MNDTPPRTRRTSRPTRWCSNTRWMRRRHRSGAPSASPLREQWLPDAVVSDPDPVSVTHEEEIRYRMRDDAPPFLESLVTFQIEPDGEGGTRLRIIHELADARRNAASGRPPTTARPG